MPVKEFEKQQIHSFIEPTDLKHNLHLVVNNALVEAPIQTFTINNRRYLGNKFKLNEFIYHNIINECGDFCTFADLFAGTGSVASLFHGKQLIVNDILYSNYVCHQTWFGTDKYSKSKIIKYLNQYNTSKVSRDNYFSKHYSNTYFSKENCRKIGYIRENIENNFKAGNINLREKCILITSLLYAKSTSPFIPTTPQA